MVHQDARRRPRRTEDACRVEANNARRVEWGMKEERVRGYRPIEASVGLNDEDTDGLSSTRARVTVPAERDKFQETRLFLPLDPNLMVLE